jgi:small-conductance mechanosensitive channel
MPSRRSKLIARHVLGVFAAISGTMGMAAPTAKPEQPAKPAAAAAPSTPERKAAPASAADPASAATPAPGGASARPATPAPGPAQPPPSMSSADVIEMLDQTVDWYRTLATQQKFSTEPSDLLILYENRQIANQVTSLAFEVARTAAKLLADDTPVAPQSKDSAASSQNIAQLQSKNDAQIASVQSELDDARKQLAVGPRKARSQWQAKVAELQGELELLNAKKSIVTQIASVMNAGSGGSAGNALRAQIDAIAVALPSIADSTAPAPAAAGSAGPGTPAPAHPSAAAAANGLPAATTSPEGSRFGIWDIAAAVFKLSEKMNAVAGVDRRTAALQTSYGQTRAKIVAQLHVMSARGDSLMAQADAADSTALAGLRTQLDALAGKFKQASEILVPLSRQLTLLNEYRHNLKNWRDAVRIQMRDSLRALALRLAILLVVLGAVYALAQVWHRAVLKYVQDARRRYQLLLLRRIALWALVVAIVGFTFTSELSSIMTFAGLITAGLAVAMQSVLVSIVGYFFLIGKYGIRVGDRVQIGEVNGEIIELGMVRMYLMEFAGQNSVSPTGRVAAFPNSVVFQVSTGLFKQIPGVNLAWHDITLSVPAGADYSEIKDRLTKAANEALADYREEIERQSRELQRTAASGTTGEAVPTVQLSYSLKGVDAHVRYPVHLGHAAEIDERMSRALLQVISGLDPKGLADTQVPR